VAIKEINQVHTDDEQKLRMLEEEWKREVKAHIDINKLNHPNIIEFIAAVTRGKRYLMFRWADGGNLREFWQTHKKPQLSVSLVRDVVMQLRGLADALDKLHGYGGGGGSYRHGDVKPDNILRVRSKPVSHAEIDVGILKIADMGLAKHHTVVTEFRPPTSMRYTTYRYEPPEVIDGISANPGRSRRQDIWSLGCVALELIIWLLYGAEVLNEFNDKWIVGDMGEPSPYFEIEGKGSHRTAKVHPAVDATMDALSRDQECRVGQDSAVKDLLRIVRKKLLVVNLGAATMMRIGGPSTPPNNSTIPVGSRASARDLCLDLDDIIGKGEKNESYWYTGKPRSHIQRLQIGRSRGSDSLLPPDPKAGNGKGLPTRSKEPTAMPLQSGDIAFSVPPVPSVTQALKVGRFQSDLITES
jgi:serine/threonine protein kinase